MRTTIIICVLSIAVLCGCKKDEELPRSIFDLSIKVDINKTDGSDSLFFDKGEDIVFSISITNPVDKAIGYYYDKVKCQNPAFGFDIYTYQDQLVGNILPGEVYCTADLRFERIEPGEVKKISRTWFEPLQDTGNNTVINDTLPRGNYYMTYNMQLIDNFIDGRDEVPAKRPVADKIFFTVK